MDMISYFVLLILTVLRFFTKKITKSSRIRNYFICTLLIGLIIKNIMVLAVDYRSNYLLTIFEFLIIMIYIRSLREAWKRIFMVMGQSI
jgi:putative effector of murein hydrolase